MAKICVDSAKHIFTNKLTTTLQKMFKYIHMLNLLFFDTKDFKSIQSAYRFRKKYPKMLIDIRQIAFILRALKGKFPCNMLVFGLGWDSLMWTELNKGGRTIFIEDNSEWFKKIAGLCPWIEAYHVIYPTKISDWECLLDKPDKLQIKLPFSINEVKWDVIFVDGPCGALEYYMSLYNKEPAGRMCSIYSASKLIKKGGDVFVDDCQRIVEKEYADKYLRNHLVATLKSATILRWYRMEDIFEKR
ncbi:MAG: hypothetical protein WC330_00930 [Candidatus Omnitrophota bacterium]|jgi:glucuronoxylan 4-O-methyltransferase